MSQHEDEQDVDFDARELPDESDRNADDGDEFAETESCPHCGADVYEQAECCPECGRNLSREDEATSAGNRPWWILLAVAAAVVAVLTWIL